MTYKCVADRHINIGITFPFIIKGVISFLPPPLSNYMVVCHHIYTTVYYPPLGYSARGRYRRGVGIQFLQAVN